MRNDGEHAGGADADAADDATTPEVRPRGPVPVDKPEFPEDVEVRLPRGLRRDIRRQVRDHDTAADVDRAIAIGSELLDADDGAAAVAYFAWAKVQASRVAEIREGLGVAHYLAGDYRSALKELRTYRRLAAAHDQDHLIADCLRGLGRPLGDVAATVEELLAADGVPPDRQVEGVLVWAGALRDADELAGARAALRRADRDLLRRATDEARARHDWLTADIAARSGDLATARELFASLATLDGDPYDAAERLADVAGTDSAS